MLRALALTWLTPENLDPVLLLGALANQPGPSGRCGLPPTPGTARVLWFTALGYGAHRGHGLLSSPRAWRVLDILIGATMLVIAGDARGRHVVVAISDRGVRTVVTRGRENLDLGTRRAQHRRRPSRRSQRDGHVPTVRGRPQSMEGS